MAAATGRLAPDPPTGRGADAAWGLPAGQVALGVEDRELVEALRRLPARYREVLVLHHCLDRSVDNVAACLGIPAATVKTRLARGRAKLAVLLDVAEPASEEGSRNVRS